MWSILKNGPGVDRRFSEYQKRWPHEMQNILVNLDTLIATLNQGARPEQAKKLGFVHSEPMGILAVDQSGKGKGSKMKEFRAYTFPDEELENLHFVRVGDKKVQSEDIAYCKKYVTALVSEKEAMRKDSATG